MAHNCTLVLVYFNAYQIAIATDTQVVNGSRAKLVYTESNLNSINIVYLDTEVLLD